MDHSITNLQESLAELVILNDIQINFTSYEAILCIKRWKFIVQIPGISQRVIDEADENIQKNFFSYMSFEEVVFEGEFNSNTNN